MIEHGTHFYRECRVKRKATIPWIWHGRHSEYVFQRSHLQIIHTHLPCLIHILSISRERVVWLRNLFGASVKAQGSQGNIDAEDLFRWVSLKLQSDISLMWYLDVIYIDLYDITFIFVSLYTDMIQSYVFSSIIPAILDVLCFMFNDVIGNRVHLT